MSAPAPVQAAPILDNRRTNVACQACRNRKVRCSKEVPCCSNCRAILQVCHYPPAVLKPGPKVGSIHKRRRLDNQNQVPTPVAVSTVVPEATIGLKERPAVSRSATGNNGEEEDTTTSDPATIPEGDALLRSQHIQTVSFLCRVSNEEPLSPKSTGLATSPSEYGVGRQDPVLHVCRDLAIPVKTMHHLVHIFFTTFTSFRLFREPIFFARLTQGSYERSIKALLAIMIAFACKSTRGQETQVQGFPSSSSSDFAFLALHEVDAAMAECGDEPPSLCLLQALILVTHWLLIKGVRGRAWRYLGLCIRIVLELGLYALDADQYGEAMANKSNPEQWCEDEEKRRAYWAVWEMDQFANHLKHVPIIMDWTQNHVLLPAEDDRWFRGQPQPSCFLESDLIARSKALHATSSKSMRAWYIVLASLNPHAHDFAYPSESMLRPSISKRNIASSKEPEMSREASRSILFHAIQLCIMLLPANLKFYGQSLDFGTRTFGRGSNRSSSIIISNSNSTSLETLHIQSYIYQLAMMPEIARLLALRPYVFEAYARKMSNLDDHYQSHRQPLTGSFSREIKQCFDAADAVINIVVNCHESHYQYVNPYTACASWLAATAFLLIEDLAEDDSEKPVIRAKFELLKATVDRFIQHWEMSIVPKQNLDALAERLQQFAASSNSKAKERREDASSQNRPDQTWLADGSGLNEKVFSHSSTAGLTPWIPRYRSYGAAAGPGGQPQPQGRSHGHGQERTVQDSTSLSLNIDNRSQIEGDQYLFAANTTEGQAGTGQQQHLSIMNPSETAVTAEAMAEVGVADPLNSVDWFSMSSNLELSGDLLDYVDIFSGTFLA
ncbi:hypothetical protein H2204_006802 [Knufia peltigerae]|uniref:Zn(2)-C6 fungal-type domain-containing protein n=1 Tax=Knufia peltigerae TaxID=1002370 RepID=A0AA39CXI0_9EURO|nr:hypothetical protein H2204_006802 [Knufia peltigerae]